MSEAHYVLCVSVKVVQYFKAKYNPGGNTPWSTNMINVTIKMDSRWSRTWNGSGGNSYFDIEPEGKVVFDCASSAGELVSIRMLLLLLVLPWTKSPCVLMIPSCAESFAVEEEMDMLFDYL